MSHLSYRAAQIYLGLLVVIGLLAAIWTYGYWTRHLSYVHDVLPWARETFPRVTEAARKAPVETALQLPALAMWVLAPMAFPFIAAAAALLVWFLRRRRAWALGATIAIAMLVIPVAYGGRLALRGLEDRRFFARSPYVRTYHRLAVPLAIASFALAGVALADRARRRARGRARPSPTPAA